MDLNQKEMRKKRNHISSKILLHCCCGPCATAVIDFLQNEGFEVTALFFNPNIHPQGEFRKRLKSWKKVCETKSIEHFFFRDPKYKPQSGKNRCNHCYVTRFKRTSEISKTLGFEIFTSTLFISPFQNHELMKEIGSKFEGFKYFDFRNLFSESKKQSKELELYSQKYCGCFDSKLEAEWLKKRKKESKRRKLGEYSPWKPDYVL